MDDILLIGNDVEIFGRHKRLFERCFSKEDLDKRLLKYWASRSIEIDQNA